MVAAAQHDPVAAVILHSSPGDVEYVVINGVLRKRAGKLVDVDVNVENGSRKLTWGDVAKEVISRREVLQRKIENIDMEAVTEALIDQWHLDRSKLVGRL